MSYNDQLTSNADALTIRWIAGEDAAERDLVERLAALDSKRPPAGPYLVVEVGGRPIAARSLRDGVVVADPFTPSADAVRLMEIRAQALLGSTARDSVGARRSHGTAVAASVLGRARRALSSASAR